MSSVIINKQELEHLKDGIRKMFFKNNGVPIKKWNSTVSNYEDLTNDINEKLKAKITNRFLKSFFYESLQTSEHKVKEENLDVLYQYAYQYNRKEYKEFAYKEEIKVGVFGNEQNPNDPQLDIKDLKFYDILPLLDKGIIVNLIIDEEFLKQKSGLQLLKEMFIDNSAEIFLDYAFNNLKFLINNKNTISQIEIWNEEFTKDNESESTTIKSILNQINKHLTFGEYGDISDVNTFYKYHYLYYSETSDNNKLGYLEDAYLETINSNIEDKKKPNSFLYLCVIAYNQFFDDYGDEVRMLRHFALFNKSLKQKNPENEIIRIFTLSCDYSNKVFTSNHQNMFSNILLYQYLTINEKSNAKTFLFLYDSKKFNKNYSNILLKQDYVLRIKNEKSYKTPTEVYYNLSKSEIYDSHSQKDNRLYIALPEDATGRNKLILDDGINNILRYFKDFQERLKFYIDESKINGVSTYKINGNSTSSNSLSLNLKDLSNPLIKILNVTDEKLFNAAAKRATKFYDEIRTNLD